MNITDAALGFVGAGNMGGALMAGLLAGGKIQARRMVAADPSPDARQRLEQLGVRVVDQAADAVRGQDIVVLAVKPQVAADVLAELGPIIRPQQVLVSIMAGVSTAAIEAHLSATVPLVRVMPQTLAQLGAGAAALCAGSRATKAHLDLVRSLFEETGTAMIVPEDLMDAVTGLAGSGPAYAYTLIQGLTDGGVRAGLPRHVAQALTAQTLLGAARMVLETGMHPAALRDQVTSPGGTTMAGLFELEAGNVRAVLMRTVEAATERSRELGRG